MKRLTKVSLITLFLLVFLCLTLLSASVYNYSSLTSESLVAELRFDSINKREYIAKLRTGDFCEEKLFRLLGDQWRLDAEFIKWKYWALALGLDSQYRLDRLEGRYRLIDDQNINSSLAHDLKNDTVLNVGNVSKKLGLINFLVDATYGTSTNQDIDNEKIFYVYRTQTGLITRSQGNIVQRSEESGLLVEITRSCGGSPGYWERFSIWLDDELNSILGQTTDD